MAFTRKPSAPLLSMLNGVSLAQTSFTMNSNDDWMASVFYWPGGDLTKCVFLCTSATGTNVVTAQLFNVDPTDAGTAPVNLSSAVGSAVDSATLATLTPCVVSGIGQASLAAGIYALRLIFKSGTSCSIAQHISAVNPNGAALFQFPFSVTVTNGGSQTKVVPSGGLSLGLGGSSWAQIDGLIGPGRVTFLTQVSSSSNPDEYGIWFTNPSVCDQRICGVFFYNVSGARPDVRIAIYTGSLASPTQVAAVTFDRDLASTQAAAGGNWLSFPESSWFTLAAGATIGIGVRAASAHLLTVPYMDFLTGNQALMDTFIGQNATLFTRENDAGALTQISYQVPFITPISNGEQAASSGNPAQVARMLKRGERLA